MATWPAGGRTRRWSDDGPAIARLRAGQGFRFLDPDGKPVDAATRDRIRSLAIPPAWTDVRISPDPQGHLQATGRDSRGRKQYRYHPAYRRRQEAAKFADLARFGSALPKIRARVRRDLRRRGVPRERVLAGVVRLLETTLVRIGNPEYAQANRSFGLTTLKDRHVTIDGEVVILRFRAKAGRVQEVQFRDRTLARLIGECKALPGAHLFQYRGPDGRPRPVRSRDVNDYLRSIAGPIASAKMFRTWAANLIAQRAARSRGRRARGAVVGPVMEEVAERLGNTPAVARRSYVHPRVLEELGRDDAGDQGSAGGRSAPPSRAEERDLIRILDGQEG